MALKYVPKTTWRKCQHTSDHKNPIQGNLLTTDPELISAMITAEFVFYRIQMQNIALDFIVFYTNTIKFQVFRNHQNYIIITYIQTLLIFIARQHTAADARY